MAKKAIKLEGSCKTFSITQQENFGFTEEVIKNILFEKDGSLWSSVSEYAYIRHDKDIDEDGSIVDPHYHLMVMFTGAIPVSAIVSRIAKAVPKDIADYILINVAQNQEKYCSNASLNPIVSYIVGGPGFPQCSTVGSKGGMLNYLTHRDEKGKHVYEVSEVITNMDYEKETEEIHAQKQLQYSSTRAFEIRDMLLSGKVRHCDLYYDNSPVTEHEMITYKRDIEESIRIYNEKQIQKGEKHMEVIFITGPGRIGKDSFAMDLFKHRLRKRVYRCNNSDNPFDNYKGEDVVIWSDARDNNMKPQQLFNLLDNYYGSRQKARYYDRAVNCETLVITSSKPLDEWYKEAFDKDKEGRNQLYGRINQYIKINRKTVDFYVYNRNIIGDILPYEYVMSMKNEWCHDDEAIEEQKGKISAFYGIMGDSWKEETKVTKEFEVVSGGNLAFK